MERDSMEFDILCVGCGVATLSTVLRLLHRVKAEGGDKAPPTVLVIDKGASVGAHVLSGAVMDPGPLTELLGAEAFKQLPVSATIHTESFRRLSAGGSLKLPWVPPVMQAHGYPIMSLSAVTQHLAKLCEAAGAEVYCGFVGSELLEEQGRITGVRVGDKGIDKLGNKRSNFEPGPDLLAKVVVLGEGACGLLSEKLIQDRNLRGANPQTYAVGVKELIETPAQPGRGGTIMHTFGYPLDYFTYGGGFIYCMSDTLTAIGLVTALDYRNPTLNPHDQFRLFKLHPAVKPFIAGGKVIEYGAKVLPEGGFNSVPTLVTDGALLVGDSAGLLDSLRLKGVHLAVQSGIAAGDALFAAWQKDDYSTAALNQYPARLQESAAWKQMRKIRNVRASFTHGMLPGMAASGMSVFTGGMLPPGRLALHVDADVLKNKDAVTPCPPVPKCDEKDAALQLDRLSDLYCSKTHHEENQPSHLKILDAEKCKSCIKQYGAPCTLFCPAQVYGLAEDGESIRVDFSNCLHCKTCQIKDPLHNIRWTAPEAGGGPRYMRM